MTEFSSRPREGASSPLPAGVEPESGISLGDGQNDPLGVFLTGSAAKMLEASVASADQAAAGLLVGLAFQGEHRPFIAISGVLAVPLSDPSLRPPAELWARLERERQKRFGDTPAVGWFTARPQGGLEFGPYERHIQRRHFRQPWQVGMLIDPQESTSAIYARAGDHFLPINGVRVIPDSQLASLAAGAASDPPAASDAAPAGTDLPSFTRVPPNGSAALGERAPAGEEARSMGEVYDDRAAREFLAGPHPASLSRGRSKNHAAAIAEALRYRERARLHRRRLWLWLFLFTATAAGVWLWVLFAGGTDRSQAALPAPVPTAAPELTAPGTAEPTAPPPPPQAEASQAAASIAHITASPAAAQPPPGPAAEEATIYIIRSGDTMWQISADWVGDPAAYRLLAELNGIEDPSLIYAGDRLRLPRAAPRPAAPRAP
ncbi:MAG TPA: LysM domain-containing protein [Limnochordia bacterium]